MEYIEKFSVQLIHGERHPPEPFGSGVLIELDGRYFIVTAGHCASDYYGHSTIHLKGANTGPPFEARIRQPPDAVYNNWDLIEDYGFYELEPERLDAVSDNGKQFLDRNNLLVLNEEKFLVAWSSAIVSGFPRSMTKLTGQQVFESCLLELAICPNMVSYSAGKRRKCISIDLTQMFGEGKPADLEGASGGGFWVLKREESGSPLNPTLAGLNVGTPNNDGTGSGRELLVTLVGHHLRRIADRIDDLKGFIFCTWPFLANNVWDTVYPPP